MIPDAATLAEFKRLTREASEIASGDEYHQLVFSAAVKLATGEWSAPFQYDESKMFPFATSRRTMTD